MLYESLLVLGVIFFAFFAPHVALGMAAHLALPGGVLLVHAVIVLALYFLWFWRRGGTLAMQTWKIQLRAADRIGPPSLGQLLLRFVLAWPSVLCVAGLVWALFDRDRQFLHDRLAGTRLVYSG